MRNRFSVPRLVPAVLGACIALAGGGCAIEVADADLDADAREGWEPLELSQASADLPDYFQQTWRQEDGIGFHDLAPLDQYWCALTGITGDFRGLGEEVFVRGAESIQPQWRIYGKSGTSGVSGTATCYKRTLFHGGDGRNFVSVEWVHQQSTPGCRWWGCPVLPPPAPALMSVWAGDSVTMITGIGGKFRGPNEFIEVRHDLTGTQPTILAAQNYSKWNQTSRMRAHSYFAGVPGRRARITGEYHVQTGYGSGRAFMAAAHEAMCFLTKISGSLHSASTSVSIERDYDQAGVAFWVLAVRGAAADKVLARARCAFLDQG